VAKDRLEAARSLAREVNRRVTAARDPLFAGSRAATRVAEAEVELELAEHARTAALARLTALWGGTSDTVTLAASEFLNLDRPYAVTTASPMAAIYAARSARAEAAVAVERSRAIQDPTVRGGLRYLRPADDVALVAGVTIPLGNKTANRAAVDRAVAERRRAEAEAAVAEAQRQRDLTLAAERVHVARMEAVGFRDRVIPTAEKTLTQVREGYMRGGFTYLDVADAQRALSDARERLVRSAREFHEAGAELDRLTGRFIPTIIEEAL
ncbi:MAG: TolC family protein, partial [Rubrivivax sp.]|nr:TolC family protein [Rubrivivax sp.]